MSDAKTIETMVELYRQRLRLRTWDEQAEHALSKGAPAGRRAGLSTRGLLAAIAQCEVGGVSLLTVDGANEANTDYCIDLGRDLVHRLALRIEVVHHRRDVKGLRVAYVDHWRGDR